MELHGLTPDFGGSKAIFQVNTLKIVELDILGDNLFDFSSAGKVHTVQTFGFESTEEILHGSVVIGASRAGHRGLKVVFLA